MPRRPFPYPPRQSSGYWSVRLPPSASIGEVRVYLGSILPPPDEWEQPTVPTTASCAITAVIPSGWITAPNQFDWPYNGQPTFKIISRARPGYTWPADAEVTAFAFFYWRDVSPLDGSYGVGSLNETSGSWNYYPPGSTTSDGTILAADSCALYTTITVPQGTSGTVRRLGPAAMQAPQGTNYSYIHTTRSGGFPQVNINICSIGDSTGPDGTWRWTYKQRIDTVGTHTTPLIPPPAAGP